MHTIMFGPTERAERALDGLMRSVEPGEVDEILHEGDGRVTVVLAVRR